MHRKKSHKKTINKLPSKMKKNYVKPCSSCIVMAAEQAMLTGSKGLRITNQDLERADHITLGPSTPSTPSVGGNAKENPFDEE